MKEDRTIWIIGAAGAALALLLLRGKAGARALDLGSAIQEEKQQGARPSYSAVEFSNYANQFYETVRYSSVSDDYGRAETILKLMNNTLDVLELVKAFGRRQEYWFGVFPDGPPKDLPTFVRDDFSQTRIDRVNADYRARGIQFQF